MELLIEGTQPVMVASGQLSPLFSGRGYPGGIRAAGGSLAQRSIWSSVGIDSNSFVLHALGTITMY